MVAFPKLKRHEIEREKLEMSPEGILSVKILGAITKKAYIKTAIDLTAFYHDFNHILEVNWENLEFEDMHGKPSEKKKGKYLENAPPYSEYKDPAGALTRPQAIYEHHYVWAKHNGFEEHETRWYARVHAKYSKNAWYEFRLQIDVRDIVEREVLIGNKKKKLYYGTWELRNEMVLKSKIIPKFLQTIPFVKNSPMLQEMYLDFTHYPTMKADVSYLETTLIPMLYVVINKHFKPGRSQPK